MNRDQLTGRQCYFLLFLFMMGNLITANGAKGKQSGWLLFLVLSVLSVPVFYLFASAAKNCPAGQIFVRSFGKKLGSIVTVAYCILAILLAGDAIRLFADFIVINDLNDAGAWGNTALLTLTVLLLLFCNMQSLGKAAWILQPLAQVLLLFSFVLTIPKMDLHRLLPLFAETPVSLLKSGIGSFTALLASAIFPIYVMSGAAPKSWKKSLLTAGTAACIMMAALAFRDAAVLGFPAVSMFRFPSFTAASMLRHSELLIAAVFVASQPFRTALFLRYVQACLTEFRPRWSRWYPPILLGLAVLSGTLSWSSEQVRWRTTGELIVSLFLLAGPLSVLITNKVKGMKKKA